MRVQYWCARLDRMKSYHAALRKCRWLRKLRRERALTRPADYLAVRVLHTLLPSHLG